jgi:hypothetical protein
MDWKARVPVLAAALWWGSLTATGFVDVPLLFARLPSAALAGQTAAALFSAQTWIALVCGLLLLMSARSADGPPPLDWARGALVYVVAGVLLALLVEFAVAPRIMARVDLQLWHSVGTVMYAAQWACALVVVWKLSSRA